MTTTSNHRTNYAVWFVIGIMLVLASIFFRLWFYPIQSADYTDSLVPWLKNLSDNPGLTAFKYPFANYPPLYLYALKAISKLPVYPLFAIKTLSVIFDVVIAFTAYKIFEQTLGQKLNKGQLFAIFGLFLAIPTILLNSSLWAQCDAIYAGFVLISFYLMIKNRPALAAIVFSLAMALKLQSIFFLPVLAGYWLTKKEGWEFLVVIPITYLIIMVPAWFSGGSFSELITKYLQQTQTYDALSMSAPSVYSFIDETKLADSLKDMLSYAGIIVAGLIAIMVVMAVMRAVKAEKFNETYAAYISLVSVLVIPYFLPHMHERYFYLADIFALVYAIYRPRFWFVPVVVISASFLSYMPFIAKSIPLISSYIVPQFVLAVINLLAVISVLSAKFIDPAYKGEKQKVN